MTFGTLVPTQSPRGAAKMARVIPFDVSTLPWHDALFLCLESHAAAEEAVMAAYEDLLSRAPGHVRYLTSLILDDERRHHRIFADLLEALASDLEADGRDRSLLSGRYRSDEAHEVKSRTEQFLEVEHQDLQELKVLGRTMQQQGDGGLLRLLVQVMEQDTAKHIAILEFIKGDAEAHAVVDGAQAGNG